MDLQFARVALSGYYSLCSVVSIPFVSVLCAVIHGVSKSLLVIRPTHGASHYAFSSSPRFNRFAYWLNGSLIGLGTPQQWTARHVIAHHIDTNLVPVDADTAYPIKRVLPCYQRYWFHAYQHIYMWLLYAAVFLPWMLQENFQFAYGVAFNSGKVYESVVQCYFGSLLDYLEAMSCILVPHSLRLIPFVLLPTWYDALFVTLAVDMTSSLWFSLQFVVNHEILDTVDTDFTGFREVVLSDERDFGVHQLLTSHNYSVGFWPALHLSGGLNHQIEHHLFPSVHYKHYPALAEIVQATAKEFNLPYHQAPSFFHALCKHHKLLYVMGRNDKSQ